MGRKILTSNLGFSRSDPYSFFVIRFLNGLFCRQQKTKNLLYCNIFIRSFDGGTPAFYSFFLKKSNIFWF